LGGGGGNIQTQIEVMRSRVLLGEVVDSLGLRLARKVPGLVRDNFEPTGLVDEVSVSATSVPDSLGLSFSDADVTARKGGAGVTAKYGQPLEVGGVRLSVPVRPDRDHLTLWVLPREDAIDMLHDDVRPASREGTNVVDVVVNGYDSIITRKIANHTAEFYQRFSSRKSREQARLRKQFVMTQLTVAESLLAVTQQQLTDFRKRERLYSSKAEAGLETTGRGELEVQRAKLNADRQVYRAILANLGRSSPERRMQLLRSLASAPSVAQHPVIGGLYAQLDHYASARDSLIAGPPRRAPTNPEVLAVDSLIGTAEVRLTSAARSYVEMLDAQISALDTIKGRTDVALQHIAETEPEEVRLALRMESIGKAATDLRARYYTAGMAEASEIDQVTILDPAQGGKGSGSGPGRSLLFGVIFGLMVGGAGAVLVDSANRSIRRRGDVEHFLRVPNLAVIPSLAPGAERRGQLRLPTRSRVEVGRGNGRGGAVELVGVDRVHSVGAEAYRTLRTNLIFSPMLETLQSIVVTSPSGTEGKTTTSANLAIAFAQKGMRVLLVDCDLRRPRVHAIFGVPREPGLSQLLLGQVAAEQVIRKTSVERLCVLPAGPLPSISATDLLDGGVVRSLIEALSTDFDLVIIDTPPVLATSTAAVLGTQVDGVLLVVRAGQTDRDAARQTLQQLGSVGARVVGTVLNDPDALLSQRNEYYEEEPARA
ncbi:MAG: polysaccharide biosynthesis tyrosine autokinase, partial [Gemmatimonadetes bacterium]|nr:polysaccharide biosynthesis tyrosine autokinase [Gemmatimonadota bacterium]